MRPPTPSDPVRRRLELPGGSATVADAGEGPVLVALHGLPGTVRDFRWLGAALEARARVVRVDLPGFGGTPAGGRSLADRAAFVRDVLDALRIERAAVLGHSMGGAVAAAVAACFPERVAGLALLASVGVRPHRAIRRFPPRVVSGLLQVPGVRAATMPAIRRAMHAAGFKGATDAELVESLHLVASTPVAEHAANLARLRVPTMVVWAEDDPMVEPAIGEELYWKVPPGPRVRFPSGGHPLANTRACEVGDALAEWLPSLDYRPTGNVAST